MKRIVLAGLLAGFVYFVWVAISHVALPFHTMGSGGFTAPDTVLQQLKVLNPEPGVYYYPGMPEGGDPAAMESMMEASRRGPAVTMLVWRPQGTEWITPGMFLKNIVVALIAGLALAWIASFPAQMGASRATLVLVGTAAGAVVAFSGPMVDWIYYHLPGRFALPVVVDHLVGWTLAGLVLAWLLRPLGPSVEARPVEEVLTEE